MSKTQRYVLNPHTFAYEPYQALPGTRRRRLALTAMAGFLVAGTVLVLLYAFLGDIEAQRFAQRNAEVAAEVQQQLETFEQLAMDLEKVHQQDNGFYRSILNVSPISNETWQAGVGGQVVDRRLPVITRAEEAIAALDHRFGVQKSSFDLLLTLAEKKTEELMHIPAIRPITTPLISGFGMRANPFHGGMEFHKGLDFRAPIGTPVKSAGSGVVVKAGVPESGYGIQVEVDHGYGYHTKYAHLSRVKVAEGDTVKRGQIIGLSGNTGYSTGPHLHYEVIKNGVKVNPVDYFYN